MHFRVREHWILQVREALWSSLITAHLFHAAVTSKHRHRTGWAQKQSHQSDMRRKIADWATGGRRPLVGDSVRNKVEDNWRCAVIRYTTLSVSVCGESTAWLADRWLSSYLVAAWDRSGKQNVFQFVCPCVRSFIHSSSPLAKCLQWTLLCCRLLYSCIFSQVSNHLLLGIVLFFRPAHSN